MIEQQRNPERKAEQERSDARDHVSGFSETTDAPTASDNQGDKKNETLADVEGPKIDRAKEQETLAKERSANQDS